MSNIAMMSLMELYHLLNRGVDKREIVSDDQDRVRFIHDLFVFNDAEIVKHDFQPERKNQTRERALLVHIHAFCLMKNHYHLLASEVVENGIPLFMKKLNMGYTKYFNERYKRTGTLWQGKYKKIHTQKDAHNIYLPYYIHLNPLDYSHPEWRQGKIKNPQEALSALNKYRWSSHLDYFDEKNFPSVSYRDHLREIVGSKKLYEKELINIMTAKI